MTVEDLQKILSKLVDEGKTQLNSEVVFRHNIHESSSVYSSVDYVLFKQNPNTLVLCYDDGHF